MAKAWSENSHPRDDAGRFVSAGEVRAAAHDPEKAEELRASVTDPSERKKLESALVLKSRVASVTSGTRCFFWVMSGHLR